MKWIALALPVAGVLVAGCNPQCGGTHNYATDQGGIFTSEDCSSFGGSHGFLYTGTNLASLTMDSNEESISEAVSNILDLTPYTIVFFRADHLSEGTVLDMGSLSGFGAHDPTASGALPTEVPLSAGSLEVLKGPKGTDEEPRYKLRWDFTIGDEFQQHEGEKWIDFSYASPDLLPNFEPPPDYDDVIIGDGPCAHDGHLTLSSQDDLLAALPLCSVSGQLNLTGSITDVSLLSDLTQVGALSIHQSQLTTLEGLEQLEVVGGGLTVSDNPGLVSMDALQGLDTVGAGFEVSRNAVLQRAVFPAGQLDIDDLVVSDNVALIEFVGADSLGDAVHVEVNRNPKLARFAVSDLATVTGRIQVVDNGALGSLSMPELTSAGDVEIRGNALGNVDGMSALRSTGGLRIEQEPLLESLDGLSSLTTVTGSLSLRALESLVRIDGFESLGEVSTVSIQENARLEGIAGFSSLPEVFSVHISGNDALLAIDGFDQLETVEELYIRDNSRLTGLAMLEGLASVTTLVVEGCDELVALTGDALSVEHMTLLRNTSLQDLGSIHVSDVVDIEDCAQLASFDLDLAGQTLSQVRLVELPLQDLAALGDASRVDALDLQALPIVSLSGLATTEVAALTLTDLPSLRSLDGLVPAIPMGDLTLLRTAVQQVDALSDVVQMGRFHATSNASLESIEGLAQLQGADSIVLMDNPNLSRAPTFADLQRVDQLWLQDTALVELPVLSGLTQVIYGVHIRDNPQLTDVGGLSRLSSTESLDISGNEVLGSITGLQALQTVSSSATISNNPELCQSVAAQVMDQFHAPVESATGNRSGC